MLLTKRSRKQIETHIAKCAESIQNNGLEIGRDLIEIRDDELWSDEYDSWNQYLKEHVAGLIAKSFAQAKFLIQAAEVQVRLAGKPNLEPTHYTELARLAPTVGKNSGKRGAEKDYSKLRKSDVNRVLKNAALSQGGISKRSIRAAVDEELGIDREADRKKKQREADAEAKQRADEVAAEMELSRVIHRLISDLEDSLSDFEKVPFEGWEWLEDHKPGLCQELARACDALAAFMRQ